MWILIAVVLIIATCICIFIPDPLPLIEEIILVSGTILSFIKALQGDKLLYPKSLLLKNGNHDVSPEQVYMYTPPRKKGRTPKGFPQYDKNNPNAVYYYKK